MNLPNDQQAEKIINGCLMINPLLIAQADISADEFYWSSTRESFRAIVGLIEQQEEVNQVSICQRTELFGRPVPFVEIDSFLDAAKGTNSIRTAVASVKEKARKRRIAKLTA